MRSCSSCGTRLSSEAMRCWLCHAAAPQFTQDVEPDIPSNVIPMDHVWGGPLARTSQHANPDPIAARILGRPGAMHLTFTQRVSAYVLHALGRRQVT